MKMKILAFVMGLFLLYGCKKEMSSNPQPVMEKHAVTFEIEDFTVSQENIDPVGIAKYGGIPLTSEAKPDSLRKVINYLVCGINGNGIRKKITQTSSDAHFGILRDTLSDGKYHITVWGLEGPGVFADSLIFDASRTSDGFASEFDIDVKGGIISRKVVLKRYTSQLHITLQNEVPPNVTTVLIRTKEWPYAVNIYSLKPLPYGSETPFVIGKPVTPGQKNTKHVYTLLPGAIPDHILEIGAFDRQGNLVVSKKITLPKIESNVRYYVTGKFFGTGTNDGFTVGIDKTWRPDQNVHF